jgi:hypothetical protein
VLPTAVLLNIVSLVELGAVEQSLIASPPPVTAMLGAVATPLTANVNGLVVVVSFSSKLIVAARVPPAVGKNWTVKVVLLPAATEVTGGVVMVKSAALVPVIDTVPSVKAAVPLLVIVYVSLLVLPTAVLLNAVSFVELGAVEPSLIASPPPVTAILGEGATPLTANVNGLLVVGSFSSKLIVAVRVPAAVGENCTVKVVLLPTATELAGGVVTVKSDALVPEIDTVPSVKAAVPLLVIV